MNESAQMNKTFGNVSSAILDSAAVVTAALGFSGALGEGVTGQALGHAAAGRIGGIGGHLMLATMNQKVKSSQDFKSDSQFLNEASDEELDYGLGKVYNEGKDDKVKMEALSTVADILMRSREKKRVMSEAREAIESIRKGDSK